VRKPRRYTNERAVLFARQLQTSCISAGSQTPNPQFHKISRVLRDQWLKLVKLTS